ncbi:hypothetical protein [Gimesia algae]|uniref:hypothetical protein n=1 Tax=Gimesia algae TaxID=2527971 RepID=UPI0011A48766|nr:hypothetical protein [Gimesia algae]
MTANPRLQGNGKTIVFVSKRPGGYGANDIWLAKLVKKSEEHGSGSAIESTTSEEQKISGQNRKTVYCRE